MQVNLPFEIVKIRKQGVFDTAFLQNYLFPRAPFFLSILHTVFDRQALKRL